MFIFYPGQKEDTLSSLSKQAHWRVSQSMHGAEKETNRKYTAVAGYVMSPVTVMLLSQECQSPWSDDLMKQ